MILLAAIVLYVIGGVAVFRHTGHTATVGVSEAKKLVHRVGSHHDYSCWLSGRYGETYHSCDCDYSAKTHAYLPGVFTLTMIAWPVYVGVWGISNGIRWYGRKTGKEVTFFVPAPKVKTTAELLADSEARRKVLESNIKQLEKEVIRR